ncbi:MAG: cob(I)yrinic acid a,c-diamide adenosyltransferase [Chloroflexi bacterium]|nr:cob(I)yrinic acid a,c-diamide adenosyltransferase [Chloroflexota bacterium]
MSSTSTRQGLIIVNTGDGKGKTTAALGVLLRAWGRGWNISVVQFIKQETGRWGEVQAAEKLGIEWHSMGDGFTWKSKDLDKTTEKVQAAWSLAQEKIAGGVYDLVILDEMTYAFRFGWLDLHEVISWLRANRPPAVHVIITGRDAPSELIEFADLVTEMCKVKHPYDRGIPAQPGIEF